MRLGSGCAAGNAQPDITQIKLLGMSRFEQPGAQASATKTSRRAMRAILATLPAPLVRVAYYPHLAPSVLSLKVRLMGPFLYAPGAHTLKAKMALARS